MAMRLSGCLNPLRHWMKQCSLSAPRDNRPETDRQLLARVGRQFIVLFFILIFFDDLLDFLLQSLHVIFELAHLFLEVIEYLVEELLEHLLHTNHHQSETLIINAALLVGCYGLYRLYRVWPALSKRLQRRFSAAWLRYKRRKITYWRLLPKVQQLKLMSAYGAGFALLLFCLTL